jgi:hypothetical protein
LPPGRGNGAMVRAGGATGTIKIDFKSVFASPIRNYTNIQILPIQHAAKFSLFLHLFVTFFFFYFVTTDF